MFLVAEVGVCVCNEELGHVVVVAGIVPPPAGFASEPFAHDADILCVRHRPYGATSDIYTHLCRNVAQGGEETLALFSVHPREGVELRHVVKRFHRICRVRSGFIPAGIDTLLQFCESVGSEAQQGIVRRHTDIVHKHTELTNAQLVHSLKLMHNLIQDLVVCRVGEGRSRMYSPDEIDLVGTCHGREVSHHILSQITDITLLLSDGSGIRVSPEAGVEWVALCAVHIHVHLVIGHEAEEVFGHLGRIGNAIVALDNTTVADVGAVVNGYGNEAQSGFLPQYLLQRGESAEHGIGVVACNQHLCHTFLVSRYIQQVAVVFLRVVIVPELLILILLLYLQSIDFRICDVARTIYSQQQTGVVLLGFGHLFCLVALFLKDGLCTRNSHLVYGT